MCGLVGIFDRRDRSQIDRRLLTLMNDSQAHRGPDDSGYYIARGIGLGHRRLSIIDLAGGKQPVFNEDRSVVVVYNGEIYNFQDLASKLEANGHKFSSKCDTEVIVHAWEEWGEHCVDRFRGMFAFALWDQSQELLFLARDRLGIKPLYYADLANGVVLFASELKALLLHPDLPQDIDAQAVEDYFAYGYVPDPRSIYRSVAKLAPGHFMILRRGGSSLIPRQYWDVAFNDSCEISEAEISEDLVPRLKEAVAIHLIADVPLGAFLSGGVDSSAVVAMMASHSKERTTTCSISFGDPQYDESMYAARVAARYCTRHNVERVDADSFTLVDRLANIYDEPFADSSAIPTYWVCEMARRRVTVALSGDGGDEVFAGYRRYRWHCYEELVRRSLPGALRRPAFGLAGMIYPKMDWAPKPLRAKSTLQAIARDSIEGYFHTVSILPDDVRRRLFSQRMQQDLQGYHAVDVLRGHMQRAPTDHPLSRVQYADMKTYLPGDILTKVDRASMANSLEVRVPILDHKFVEWAAKLPPDLKLRGRTSKYIFKKALEGHVPEDVLYRSKMGFAVPLAGWFRGPLRQQVRDAIVGPMLEGTGIFDMKQINSLVDQHQSGMRDHSAPIWALVMFSAFLRQVHFKSNPPGPNRSVE